MLDFYFFTIFIALLSFLSKKMSFLFLVIGVATFLLILPDNGLDYSKYEATFYSGRSIDNFPFFKSDRLIDSEPLYLWYSALMSVLLKKSFTLFLSLNFIISVAISYLALKRFNINYFYLFWLFLLPIIVPTLFYFSPRSSISFILVLIGFISLINNKYILSLSLLFAAITFHSQYILISLMFVITYVVLNYMVGFNLEKSKKIILIITSLLTVFLVLINNFLDVITSILIFLPSADIAMAKLSYFENSRDGFRITSVLSLIVYPMFTLKILNKFKNGEFSITGKRTIDNKILIMFFAIICFGAAINISFFTDPHLAGRLSRISDYLGMGLIVPFFLLSIYEGKFSMTIFLLYVILAPFLYPTLYYNVNWGF